MPIYGLRPRLCGYTEYFGSDERFALGDHVLASAPQGVMVTTICSGPLQALPGSSEKDLPRIIRLANDEDMNIFRKNNELAQKAKDFCKARIKFRKLDMKLVEVEVFFDRSKIIFYFTSPNRIDFRELVKDLVAEYRARIELRQIGVRHETQMLGAIGNCGQICCCRRYLRQFAPVTIRMAKDQNLFLNPSKISGICGRLLCCLSYEQDTYEKFQKVAPRPGRKYQTDSGIWKIIRINMFKNSLTVLNEKNEEQDMLLETWQSLHPVRLKYEQQEEEDFPEQEWN